MRFQKASTKELLEPNQAPNYSWKIPNRVGAQNRIRSEDPSQYESETQ